MFMLYRRWFRHSVLFLLGVVVCLGLSLWGGWQAGRSLAQSPSPVQAVEQGLRSYREGKFLDAIAIWQQVLPQVRDPRQRAILYSNLGQAYRQVGRFDQAIAQWEAAIAIYRSDRDAASQQAIAQLLTEQAQTYGDLGQHQVAIERLQDALKLTQTTQDSPTQVAAQGALGNAYWALGTYEEALVAHQNSLTLACKLNHTNYITTSLNNLGNVFSSRAERYRYQATAANLEGDSDAETDLKTLAERDIYQAVTAYQHSAEVSRRVGGLAEARALLNLNRLLYQVPAQAIATLPPFSCNNPDLTTLPTPVAGSQPLLDGSAALPAANRDLIDRNRRRILALLEAEPNSQDKAYGLINLADSVMKAEGRGQRAEESSALSPSSLLEKALVVARNIRDGRAESFALGTWGHFYEVSGKFDQATRLTRQAQYVAQGVNAADSLYRWQWQIGRLLKASGQTERAIATYEQAIATLQSIRGDIVVANKDLQFDFRDSVEPVYRELIGLLLSSEEKAGEKAKGKRQKAQEKTEGTFSLPQFRDGKQRAESGEPPSPPPSPLPPSPLHAQSPAPRTQNRRNIQKVLNILELLKLAELQNFFGDDCVQVARDAASAEQSLRPEANNEPTFGLIDPQAAVIYSIVLEDRSYMLLRLPNGELRQYSVQLGSATTASATKQLAAEPKAAGSGQLQAEIDRFRQLLEKRSTEEYLTEARVIYDALIRPMIADLQAANPKTLVFVNDGVLRKVPMGALHDGKQFLIEQFPIATTPSLSLTTRRPLDRSNLKALIMGLTVEQPPFAPLPNVGSEVEGVRKILGGSELLDQSFTLEQMQERLRRTSYPIVHMATHGKFGADAASTFLLAYGDRITINQLDEALRTRQSRQPVELLTLSACQTAAGDNRSALGIAGVAVRAGVKSALATLWFINDQATVPLIEEFYSQLLKSDTTKAEALRQAQLKLIRDREYNHPAVWSPFILIGNWL
jgi:CHAT domain-containing protein/lipopolysaccharide biosynthesis regulator YciM